MHTEINTVEFESYIEVGHRCLSVFIEASRKDYFENYGADADGRRGLYMCVESDLEEVAIYDSMGNDITAKVKTRYEKYYDKFATMALQAAF